MTGATRIKLSLGLSLQYIRMIDDGDDSNEANVAIRDRGSPPLPDRIACGGASGTTG